jgi:hypothetical protein
VVSSLPLQLLEIFDVGDNSNSAEHLKWFRIFRIAKLQRLIRLLRLLKLIRLLKQNKQMRAISALFKFTSGGRQLLTIFMTIIFATHLVGCFWFLVAKENEFKPSSWVVRQGIQDEASSMKYLQSVYWAF